MFVHFVTSPGKVGGTKGSRNLQDFSSRFEWANYNLGLNILSSPANLTQDARRKGKDGSPPASSSADTMDNGDVGGGGATVSNGSVGGDRKSVV